VSADVSREPPPEINLDLPLSSVTNVKYLAQGAMCAVYSAVLDGCQVVVKTPLTTSHHFEIAANDIEVEMVLLSSLRHKNIVSIKVKDLILLEYFYGSQGASVADTLTLSVGSRQASRWPSLYCSRVPRRRDSQ
jgi:hypothetical protein